MDSSVWKNRFEGNWPEDPEIDSPSTQECNELRVEVIGLQIEKQKLEQEAGSRNRELADVRACLERNLEAMDRVQKLNKQYAYAIIFLTLAGIMGLVTLGGILVEWGAESKDHQKTKVKAHQMAEDNLSSIMDYLRKQSERAMKSHQVDTPTEQDSPASVSEPDHR